MTRPLAAILTLAALLLPGCGTSIWQAAYRPSPLAPTATEPYAIRDNAAPDADILIREAPWPRVEAALLDLEQQEAESDIHITQWDEPTRLAAARNLLTALQLPGDDPASTSILGWSSFATTDPVRVEPGLRAQARRVNADTVIWSSRVIGVGTRVIDRPVHVHHHGWGHYYDRDDRRWRSAFESHIDTAWVPVVVEADRVAYVAFFLRRGG